MVKFTRRNIMIHLESCLFHCYRDYHRMKVAARIPVDPITVFLPFGLLCTIFMSMKGVILAGGKATRLYPLTLVTNKHLLPVYDKPVIYYAVEKMVEAGIDRITIVTSP